MHPILFDSKATSFTSNGIGRLSDAASCKVVEERNGSYELEMEYPMNGLHFSDLKNGNIIYAKPFQNGNLQAFRIYKIQKKARDLAEIYARHISYQLSFIPVYPEFTAGNATDAFTALKSHAAENCPFNFSSTVTKAGTFQVTKPDSFRALLGGQEGSVLDIFHGEYEWDNYNVILHNARGANKGVTISYGKNLIDLSQEENIENTVTGIFPFWQNTGNDPAAILGLAVIVGYFRNNVFYEDKNYTKRIEPAKDKNYQDKNTKKVYFWDGKNFGEDTIGRYGEGNIDLYDRPVYINDDKSISTVDSISTRIDGQEVLIPTIGRDSSGAAVKWTNEQAISNYNEKGEYLGKFARESEANAYARKLHEQQERLYGEIGETKVYIELPEKVLYSDNASNFPFKRSVVKDFTQVFNVNPTVDELRDYTKQYIKDNKIGVPNVNLDVNFINLFETPGYKDVAALQTVNLCDTVTVVFQALGVSTTAKVVKTDYDVLRERYNEVEIGDSNASLSSTISDQLEQVSYRPTVGQVTKAIDRATGVLNAATRGHVILNRNDSGWANELLFLDNDNVAQAENVLRINMDGIGFSSTGYKGPYYQSWTNDGHLTLGGINDSYGTLEILDENAKPTLFIDKDGLKLLALEYVGYFANGTFYTDETLTTELPKKQNRGYYDRSTSKLYQWNGSAFTLNEDASVIAQMTHDGVNIKQGVIDILMDNDDKENVGFHVDSEKIILGEFEIVNTDRQVFQSRFNGNVGRTGMSANTLKQSQLYFWADWMNEDNYGFCVNGGGAYAMTTDRKDRYQIADTLRYLDSRIKQLQEEIDELSPTPSSSGGGRSGGEIGGYEDIAPGSQH